MKNKAKACDWALEKESRAKSFGEREDRGQTEEGEKKMKEEDEPDLCGLK